MVLRSTRAKERRYGPHVGHTFSFGNLLGDPFAIATLSIAIVMWIVIIVGSTTSTALKDFPTFSWWSIAFQMLMIICIMIIYMFDMVDYYKAFLCVGQGIAFVYTTNSSARLIYAEDTGKILAASGFVVLSVLNLVWLFYFGGDNASPINRWIDSFSVRGIRNSTVESSLAITRARKSFIEKPNLAAPVYSVHETQSQNYMSSTALNGFENAEPHANHGFGMGPVPQPPRIGGMEGGATNTYITDTTNGNTETTMGDTLGLYSNVGDELVSFPYTAKALYSYDADASDAYEISFEQDEILRVGDIEGRWWKAKKANGETGIIPSNYVELIETKQQAK